MNIRFCGGLSIHVSQFALIFVMLRRSWKILKMVVSQAFFYFLNTYSSYFEHVMDRLQATYCLALILYATCESWCLLQWHLFQNDLNWLYLSNKIYNNETCFGFLHFSLSLSDCVALSTIAQKTYHSKTRYLSFPQSVHSPVGVFVILTDCSLYCYFPGVSTFCFVYRFQET